LWRPPVVLGFFLSPPAVMQMTPKLLENFWDLSPSECLTQSEQALQIATHCLEQIVSHCTPHQKQQLQHEFRSFQGYCKDVQQWGPDQEKSIASQFPLLSRLRKRLISSPATSSSSERGFSTTRRIETSDRNRLSERTTEALTFLHLNLRPKEPKEPILWEHIDRALNPQDRSRLNADLVLSLSDSSEGDHQPSITAPSPEISTAQGTSSGSRDQGSLETDDVDDDGRPIFRALHASPDSNPLQSMPVMRYYELDYVSPFITSQFDPTSVNTVRDLQSARHPHPADDFSDPDSEFSLSSE